MTIPIHYFSLQLYVERAEGRYTTRPFCTVFIIIIYLTTLFWPNSKSTSLMLLLCVYWFEINNSQSQERTKRCPKKHKVYVLILKWLWPSPYRSILLPYTCTLLFGHVLYQWGSWLSTTFISLRGSCSHFHLLLPSSELLL